MRLLRGLAGALLWIGASLLGLVAVILCITVILLPVGIPLLRLSGQLFGKAVRLMLPPELAHPVKEMGKKGRKKGTAAKGSISDAAELPKKGRKQAKKARKGMKGAAKKGKKLTRKQRHRLG